LFNRLKPDNYCNKESLDLYENNTQSNFSFTILPQQEFLFYMKHPHSESNADTDLGTYIENSTASRTAIIKRKEMFNIEERNAQNDFPEFGYDCSKCLNFCEKGTDIIIRNAYPLCKYHMLFLPFFLENNPQFINKQEIIERVLNVFYYLTCVNTSNNNPPMFNEENLVMAYNSKGASSSINSLHFQMYMLSEFSMCYDDLYFRKENYFDEEIVIPCCDNETNNSLNVEMKFCEKENTAVCFKISPIVINYQYNCNNQSNNPSNKNDQNNQISFVIYKIVQILNEGNIPYNIIFILDEVFIFFRKHQNLMENSCLGSNELLGLVLIYTKEEYDSFNPSTLIHSLKCSMLPKEVINDVLEKVKERFRRK
jgi:hypothetical protein